LTNSDHGLLAFISGFCAGMTGVINNHEKLRMYLALYLLMRALEAIYKKMEEKGWVKTRNWYHLFLNVPYVFVTFYLFFNKYTIMKD
jgi:hypothetical protein